MAASLRARLRRASSWGLLVVDCMSMRLTATGRERQVPAGSQRWCVGEERHECMGGGLYACALDRRRQACNVATLDRADLGGNAPTLNAQQDITPFHTVP